MSATNVNYVRAAARQVNLRKCQLHVSALSVSSCQLTAPTPYAGAFGRMCLEARPSAIQFYALQQAALPLHHKLQACWTVELSSSQWQLCDIANTSAKHHRVHAADAACVRYDVSNNCRSLVLAFYDVHYIYSYIYMYRYVYVYVIYQLTRCFRTGCQHV